MNDDFEKVKYNYFIIVIMTTVYCLLMFYPINMAFAYFDQTYFTFNDNIFLIILGSILMSAIKVYNIKTYQHLHIYIGPNGIKWGEFSKVVTWSEMTEVETAKYFHTEMYEFISPHAKYQFISFDPYTKDSLIPLLLLYCPDGHILKNAALRHSKKKFRYF